MTSFGAANLENSASETDAALPAAIARALVLDQGLTRFRRSVATFIIHVRTLADMGKSKARDHEMLAWAAARSRLWFFSLEPPISI